MNILEVLDSFSPTQLSNGEIKMHCPFKENHSVDSQGRKQMFVNSDLNRYHCFSCGAKGLATKLLTGKLGVPLSDAIEIVQLENFGDSFTPFEEQESIEPNAREWIPDHLINFDEAPIEFLERGFLPNLLQPDP